jgi:hypothetical protein
VCGTFWHAASAARYRWTTSVLGNSSRSMDATRDGETPMSAAICFALTLADTRSTLRRCPLGASFVFTCRFVARAARACQLLHALKHGLVGANVPKRAIVAQ